MIRFEEACTRLLALATSSGNEGVALERAEGRVLAEDVIAPEDLPGFDYSAMDGYAVRLGDLDGAGPWRFTVSGESRAGGVAQVLPPSAVARIFTGGMIPPGADAVVMQEEVERQGEVAVFTAQPKPGAHIRRRGEDLAKGRVALATGTRLCARHLALAAAADAASLVVARSPVVGILVTGDELRD